MQKLTVVNRMLATIAEKGLTSLTDTHRMLADCLDNLDEANRQIQADGWWFNMETVTLIPNNVDSGLYLPNDCLSVRTPTRNLVKRGNRVYNLDEGSYIFTTDLEVELIREVEFEDLPEIAASYIAATAVLQFQTSFDGDAQRTGQLNQTVSRTFIGINTAHTRNRRSNFINSNARLQRLKWVTRQARRDLSY